MFPLLGCPRIKILYFIFPRSCRGICYPSLRSVIMKAGVPCRILEVAQHIFCGSTGCRTANIFSPTFMCWDFLKSVKIKATAVELLEVETCFLSQWILEHFGTTFISNHSFLTLAVYENPFKFPYQN